MIRTFALSLILTMALSCPDDAKCSRCSPQGKNCEVCHGGYSNRQGRCHLVTTNNRIPNCDLYEDRETEQAPLICKKCQPGFGFAAESEKKKCVRCADPNCADCTLSSHCSSCKDLRKIEFTPEGPKCLEEKVEIPNCQQAQYLDTEDKYTCVLCASGYALEIEELQGGKTNQACVQSPIANCLSFYKTSSNQERVKCLECAKDYAIVNDGTCKTQSQFYLWQSFEKVKAINPAAKSKETSEKKQVTFEVVEMDQGVGIPSDKEEEKIMTHPGQPLSLDSPTKSKLPVDNRESVLKTPLPLSEIEEVITSEESEIPKRRAIPTQDWRDYFSEQADSDAENEKRSPLPDQTEDKLPPIEGFKDILEVEQTYSTKETPETSTPQAETISKLDWIRNYWIEILMGLIGISLVVAIAVVWRKQPAAHPSVTQQMAVENA